MLAWRYIKFSWGGPQWLLSVRPELAPVRHACTIKISRFVVNRMHNTRFSPILSFIYHAYHEKCLIFPFLESSRRKSMACLGPK